MRPAGQSHVGEMWDQWEILTFLLVLENWLIHSKSSNVFLIVWVILNNLT